MATEKMPDVIWSDIPNDNVGVYFDHSPQCVSEKYLRAEPVEELLKHARHYLDGVARDAYDNSIVCEIIHKIDNFLGEK